MNLLSDRDQLRRLRASVRKAVKADALRLWVRVRKAVKRLAKFDDPHDPDEPYAMVTAPTRPRLPRRSGAVAVDPYEY